MNIAQKKAIQFIWKYKIKRITPEVMADIFKRQGYKVFRFCRNGASSDEVENFLESRNLDRLTRGEHSKDGFTYVLGNDRAVLVNDLLSEDSMIQVLLHEQGHILLEHLYKQAKDGVQFEQEANAFAFYVMHYINLKERFRLAFLIGGVLLIAFYLVMLLVLLMR